MKTLVIYYSFTGKTKKIAADKAKKENADLVEVKAKKPYSKFGAYVFGGFAAMKQKPVKIEEINCDFTLYDKIIIAAPVWAGFPAPPANAVIAMLPAGKDIELVLSSGGGDTSKNAVKIKSLVTGQKCVVTNYTDIKS